MIKKKEMRPIFISGLYRSGTKLLTRLIEQSREVKTTYDTIHFLRFSHNKYSPIELKYDQLVYDTRERVFNRWNMDFNADKTLECIKANSVISEAIVYDCMMREFLGLSVGQRWAEKTNVEWEGMSEFLDLFPHGQAIHIYRDPRAVLASYKHMTNQEGIKYLDAVFASLAMFNFIEQEHIKNNPRILLLKYEDFVLDPERAVRNICSFLGIEYEPSMLDASAFTDKYGNKLDTDSSFTEQKDKIDASSMEIWKEKLNSVEVYLTEMVLKDRMKIFGYELSGVDLSQQEFVELYAVLHDKFLIKRYKYWLKYANGVQAYPSMDDAYTI